MKEHQEPAERKVQLTGGSTYTVSLPKEWAGEQEIEPGCYVNLYSRGDQLVMTRSNSGPDSQKHITHISADGRDPSALALSVASAYVAGCDEIRIDGLGGHEQRRAITRTIRNFVGLEVMVEDERSLIARTMLDVGDLSPEQTLAQLERTTLEMHEQAMKAVAGADGDVGRRVARQDDDVDRLFALVSRGFQQSLVDPAVTMGSGGLTSFEYYMAARQLERVADHAEKIALIADRLDAEPPADLQSTLLDFGERSREVVRRSLAGLLEEPIASTSKLSGVIADAEALLSEVSGVDAQLYDREDLEDGYLLGLVIDSLTRSTQYGVNIAEVGLQTRHRGGDSD